MSSFAILTNTGRNKEAASLATGAALNIVSLAWGDGDRIPAGGETSLLNELGRKDVQAQGVVSGANNAAFFDILLDETEGPFVIREAGLFDADGDLIAIAKYDPVVNKPLNTVSALLRINIVFSDLENLVLQVSSTNAFVPAERQIIAGVGLLGGGDLSNDRTISADIASQSEALAGTSNAKLVTPLRLAQAIIAATADFTTAADVQTLIDALINGAPDALNTLNELATALGDNDNELAAIITQLSLKLDATTYTAADVLTKIKTVDGAGSGLDADFVRGNAPVFTKEYGSTDQTIVNGGGLTLAHSMGDHPKIVVVEVICITADGSFVVGSIINISAAPAHHTGTSDTGALISPDATNIVIRIASYGLASYNPSTGAKFYLNSAKWKMRVRTYA